jgi:hypothetical protein
VYCSRTTTLEDIYRHYEDLAAEDEGSHDSSQSAAPEYDGEVTGYAVQHTATTGQGPGKTGHGGGVGAYGYGGAGGSDHDYSSSG